MKVTVKIPLPTKGEFTTVEANGTPTEVAEFLRLWMTPPASVKASKRKEENPLTT